MMQYPIAWSVAPLNNEELTYKARNNDDKRLPDISVFSKFPKLVVDMSQMNFTAGVHREAEIAEVVYPQAI